MRKDKNKSKNQTDFIGTIEEVDTGIDSLPFSKKNVINTKVFRNGFGVAASLVGLPQMALATSWCGYNLPTWGCT